VCDLLVEPAAIADVYSEGPTRFAFEIARTHGKYVEVTYDLDEKRFGEVQRIVHIVFGIQG
jgi:hypothetical protein